MSTSSLTNLVSSSSSKILKSKIEKIVFGGSGLFRSQGCVVFVPFTAPGDEIEARVLVEKKDYKLAQLHKLIKPSPDRTSPLCPYYTQCGGCQLQHLKPDVQLKVKRDFLEENFGYVPPLVFSNKVWHYRTHLRFNLENGTFGFKACDQKTLVEIEQCALFEPPENTFFQILRTSLRTLKENGSFRIFKVQKNQYVIAFSFPKDLPKERNVLSEKLMQQLPIQGIAMKSPKREEHFGNTVITDKICGLNLIFSPYSFMQNNPFLIPKLYETLVSWAEPKAKSILDLYSGIGITSLLLAQAGGIVIGVEENCLAVKCARRNQELNGIQGVTFLLKQAEKALKFTKKVDLIVVNPPRSGLSKEVRAALNAIQPKEILYISCMPSTLKRDIAALNGYERQKLLGFDLFPQTTHVETVVKLIKKSL